MDSTFSCPWDIHHNHWAIRDFNEEMCCHYLRGLRWTCTGSQIDWCTGNSYFLVQLWLRHTCTNPWELLKWPTAITRLTAHFICGLMSALVIWKQRKEDGNTWYRMSLLGPSVANNTKLKLKLRLIRNNPWSSLIKILCGECSCLCVVFQTTPWLHENRKYWHVGCGPQPPSWSPWHRWRWSWWVYSYVQCPFLPCPGSAM